MSPNQQALVSVVIPAHNEATAIPDLLQEVFTTLETEDVVPQVIVVDDGSSDATAEVIMELRESNPRLELVRLSRNFGHQAALLAGLRHATGDVVICMDGDGQHPPDVLPRFLDAWRDGAEVVHSIRRDPATTPRPKRLTSSMFYSMFRKLSGLQLEEGMADFRLLSRRALDATLHAVGSRPFFRGTAVWIGFAQATVSYEARERAGGSSSYSITKMARLARDGVVGFSARPLWIISAIGVGASLAAFTTAVYAIVVGLASDQAVPGWASTVGALALLQGLSFALLGTFGVYLGAIFVEVQGRPTYIVADVNGESFDHRHLPEGE